MKSLSPAERRLVEKLGHVVEAGGIARIAGQIWGLLVVSSSPLNSAEIAELLQVSRGSVSNNSRLLVSLGILEPLSRPADRQTYFAPQPDGYGRVMRMAARRAHDNAGTIASAAEQIEDVDTRERIAELERFFAVWAETFDDAAGRLVYAEKGS